MLKGRTSLSLMLALYSDMIIRDVTKFVFAFDNM